MHHLVLARSHVRIFVLLCCAGALAAGCGANGSQLTPASSSQNDVRVFADVTSKSVTQKLNPGGGTIAIPKFDGFTGSLGYAKNNARPGVDLTLESTGHVNAQGIPTPPASSAAWPLLYLTARTSSTNGVTFASSGRQASIVSTSFVPRGSYQLYLYKGHKLVAEISGATPAKGALRFPTVLADVTITPKTTLAVELAGPTPSPSPSPTPTPRPSPTATPTPGPITEYSVPTANAGLREGITLGPDGALYFVEMYGGKIGRITTAGTITEYSLPSNYWPWDIAVGSDDAFWITERKGYIARMTTAGAFTQYLVPGPGGSNSVPQDITNGPDGALYFTDSNITPSAVGRITTTGSISQEDVPGSFAFLFGITTGPDKALWFTWSGGLGRITTGGTMTEPSTTGGYGLTTGPDGAFWVAGGGVIDRITTDGTLTNAYSLYSGNAEGKIAVGPDGALWFTEWPSSIGRITTTGQLTEYSVPTASSEPTGIVAGPDGAMWFTEFNTNNIGRIPINPIAAAARHRATHHGDRR